MLVLTIVAVLALLFAVLGMTLNFGEHCQTKFGFKPMAGETLCLWQLYAILFYGGWMWMANAAQAHGDILNGMLVAGAGLFGACWLVVNNYRRTNLALRRRHNGIADRAGRDPLSAPITFQPYHPPLTSPQQCTKAAAR